MNRLWRGSIFQRLRLGSGLILFIFAATHFLNHALGLISLTAMNEFDAWRISVIRSRLGTIVLSAALIVHIALALSKLVARRTLRIPAWEATQLVLGLAIPILLFPHIVNTRFSSTFFGVHDTYTYELIRIWPSQIIQQTSLLLLVWIHGCIGLHYWLRLSSIYKRIAPYLLASAAILPFAAFVGVSIQGRALQFSIENVSVFADIKAMTHWPNDANFDVIKAVRDGSSEGFAVLLLIIGAISFLRAFVINRGPRSVVSYVGGPTVIAKQGETLLEVSRRNKISHLSICGGRGRCSTCRVLILEGDDALDPPSTTEGATLLSVEAGRHTRLACQIKPKADITVKTLLKGDQSLGFVPAHLVSAPIAVERDLAVLFVDMRGFTNLTENRLAFDVVYILNKFFNAVGRPIYDQGGVITNYSGDGLIALFADPNGLSAASRSAVLAASAIDRAVEQLNEELMLELKQPIGVAMGLHAGPHVQGRIGYKDSAGESVIGLAMNIASRLESLAKQRGAQIALSRLVAESAGLVVDDLLIESTAVRGLKLPLDVVLMQSARDISSRFHTSFPR